MKEPIYTVSEETKSDEGRLIKIKGELFEDKILSNQEHGDIHVLVDIIEQEHGLSLGKIMFPKLTEEQLKAQVELMAKEINTCLKCL